jgi:hypothetical protein
MNNFGIVKYRMTYLHDIYFIETEKSDEAKAEPVDESK